MLTASGFLIGFAYKAYAADETTLYVVNVCGHDSVGLPLARSMNTVDDSYIEYNGVDNLIIPISVSEPRHPTKGDFAFCIDVVVHTVLIKKCTPKHHLFQHLTEKLLALSMEWVQRECGIQLLLKGCTLLGNPYYYSEFKSDGSPLEEIMKMASQLLEKEGQHHRKEQEASKPLPNSLNLNREELKEDKKPLIQEVITSPGIKKGFLIDKDVRLYGPEGSLEGSGKTPDPLAHIPESLRSKCKIVDMRSMDQLPSQATKPKEAPSVASVLTPKVQEAESTPVKANARASFWTATSIEQIDGNLVVRFGVPGSFTSLRDVDLSATANSLEINGVVTQLPVTIDTGGVRAKFLKTHRILVVTCPIVE